MRIAYGIQGLGRGHFSRALAVLPELSSRHEMLLLSAGHAYDALSAAGYEVACVPRLRCPLNKDGRRSAWRTLIRNVPNFLDLWLHGPGLERVCDVLTAFRPQLVISDSQAWTHWAARRLRIPRISFDNYAALYQCRWPMSWSDRVARRLEAFFYRRLMAGTSDAYVDASFLVPPAKRPRMCVVGPVLRDYVRQARPRRGDYLLVYLTKGHILFTRRVEDALHGLDLPVVVYGTGRDGTEGNLDFRPPSNTRFVDDLAGCRAVVATAGSQLIAEAIHFRKPLLLMPYDSFEQRLNATAIERMGLGVQTSRRQVCAEQIEAFLANESDYVAHFPDRLTDGCARAIEAIERFAAELVAERK